MATPNTPPPREADAPMPARPDRGGRRLYNVVDPSALARVFAGALIYGHGTDGAAEAVRVFVDLVQEEI